MKPFCIFAICLLLASASFAQIVQNTSAVITPEASTPFSVDEKVFNRTEQEAEFTGGQKAWSKYLDENLEADTPAKSGLREKSTYTVIIKFIVSKDGNISNVVAETNYGYGMEKEAIRVISNSPKWMPALQNKRPVNAYRRQPITFMVM